MSPDKTAQLVADHPSLYSDDFHFECLDGWYVLIDTLSEYIENQSPGARIVQVKEKFGELRVYTRKPLTQGAESARWFAASLSTRVCEACGAPGELKGDGWVYTRCDSCE